jgi:hypothetical protein
MHHAPGGLAMSNRKSLIDQILEAASARGIYNPTPHAPGPIDIPDDSLVPAQDRLAYHLLKSNGFAPPFIEERTLLLADFATLTQARDALLAQWPQLTVMRQTQSLQQLRTRLHELWRRTRDYNLQAPPALQIGGVRVDYELRDFGENASQ